MAVTNSKDIRQNLLHKLRGGNKRYAHLNATTGKSRQKIDFMQLNLIKEGLAEDFLAKLLSADKFRFEIPLKDINKRLLEYTNRKKEDVEQDKLELLQELQKLSVTKKGLEFLHAHQKEEESELGTKSFAFGYPILLEQTRAGENEATVAPLFLWYLDVERDYRNDSLVLSRNEDSPIVFNEMLDYYLESELKLDFSDTVEQVNARVSDDGILNKEELVESVKDITTKLSTNFLQVDLDTFDIVPVDRKAAAKKLTDSKVSEMILNAGIFGIFRSGKQSIINDLKKLIELEDTTLLENPDFEIKQDYPFSVINTDPSQERVVESLASHQNLIIQGPPGTGKSQTLTALITNALANNQRTLVVCEKRTAMEIIKKNLEDCGLEDYVALIESVNRDRGYIVERARSINESKNVAHYNIRTEFETAESLYRNSALKITRHHNTIAALKRQYGDRGVYGQYDNKYFLGKYLKMSKLVNQDDWNRCETEFSKIPFTFTSIELDRLINDLAEAEDKLYRLDSQLRLIPILELPRTNYQQDRDVIEGYFKDKLAQLKTSQQELANIRSSSQSALREAIQSQLAAAKSTAAECQALISILAENFDWAIQDELLSKSLFSTKLGDERVAQSIEMIRQFEYEARRCHETKRDVLAKVTEALKQYVDTLHQIAKDLTRLHSLGVDTATVSTSDNVLSVFGSKRKEVKSLKNTVSRNVAIVNRLAAEVSHVVQLNQFSINGLVPEMLRSSMQSIPSVKTLVEHINDAHVATLLPENKVSKEYATRKVGEYTDVLIDEQYKIYDAIKPEIAKVYLRQLIVTVPGLYKDRIGMLGETLDPDQIMSILNSVATLKTDDIELNNYVADTIDRSKLRSLDHAAACADNILHVLEPTEDHYSLALAPNHKAAQNAQTVSELAVALDATVNATEHIMTDVEQHLFSYYKWCVSFQEYSSLTKRIIVLFTGEQIAADNWSLLLQAMYYKQLVMTADKTNLLNDTTPIDRFMNSSINIKSLLLDTIAAKWAGNRHVHIGSLEKGALKFNSLYNVRGAKGQRRNSLRKIVEKDFDLFTSLFPVVICNPGTVASLFSLEKDLFDLVLFDEASQLRLEDTYTSLYRGKAKIISGDQHQMPPSSYYESATEIEDEEYDDDEAIQISEMTNAESLLDYANINGYISEMLKIHYRSDHEDLIQFSNYAFYDAKLMPIPKFETYVPIEYQKVDGLYENRTNNAEADYVIQWLKGYFETTDDLQSVGVVTLNLPQSDLIREKLNVERTDNEHFNHCMIKLDELGFFVKNLENVQGDERDIMMLSTTFGKDKDGKFKEYFGPLNRAQGYRLLNVLVTRAKHKFIIATSVPDESIARYEDELNLSGKDGKAIFYSYLAYARAVAEADNESKSHILNSLRDSGQDRVVDNDGYTESPFEEEVLEVLQQAVDKDRIRLQFQVGGENFRIDMVILNKACTKPILAIECDGYTYHSDPQAYLYDAYRREILKTKGGFDFYSIWSTNWFHDQRNEEAKLISTIREYDARY